MTVRKTALVTGGSRGIGRGIVLALARDGYNVAINYVNNAQAAEEARLQAQWLKVNAIAVQGDVAIEEDRARMVEQTLEAFGRIDLLVNNAGAGPAVRGDLLEVSQASFDRMIEINLKAPFFLSQRVARVMLGLKQKPPADNEPAFAGKIVNITSISVYAPSINRGDYCIAKSGQAMMTQLFAARLAGDGINVYEIRPGIIETELTLPFKEKYDELILKKDLQPIARWGNPDDVARAVSAIAMDLLPFSTGQVIDVDGGFHIRRL